MFLTKKSFFIALALIFLFVAGSTFAAESDGDSIGLDMALGFTAKELTASPAFGIDFGLSYVFGLWGYDVGVGIDAFEWYFTPENELNLGIYYWYGKYIGDSAFSYYSIGEYFLRFLDNFNYDGVYTFGVAYDLDEVRMASINVIWTYYEEVSTDSYTYGSWSEIQAWLMDTKLDAALGIGYEFDFGNAGNLALWMDTTVRFYNEFGLNSINPTASYTYCIPDMIPLTASLDFELLPMDSWANELSASISAGIEL